MAVVGMAAVGTAAVVGAGTVGRGAAAGAAAYSRVSRPSMFRLRSITRRRPSIIRSHTDTVIEDTTQRSITAVRAATWPVVEIIGNGKLAETDKPSAAHVTDFDVRLRAADKLRASSFPYSGRSARDGPFRV
jgi:hypothetical protein